MALTKFNYNSFDVTPVASNAFAFNSTPNGLTTASSGAMNLITTNTISSGVSSSSFTSNINSTYDTYLFKFINIHGATENILFTFNFSKLLRFCRRKKNINRACLLQRNRTKAFLTRSS